MFIQIKKLSYVISLLFLIVHIPYSYTSQVMVVKNTNTIYLNLSNPDGENLKLKLEQAFLKDKKEGLFENYNFDDFCSKLSDSFNNRKDDHTHKIHFIKFLLATDIRAADYTNTTDDDSGDKIHQVCNMPFSHLLQELMNYSDEVISLVSNLKKHSKYFIKQGANTNLSVHLLTKGQKQKIEQLDKQLTRLKFIIALCILLIGVREMLHFYH